MGLRQLDIQREYRTKVGNIARGFLVPVLSEAVLYKRAVGFFSSSSLAEVAQGVGRIAKRGGHIRLIASPKLSEEDVKAISRGYDDREQIQEKIIRDRLIGELAELSSISPVEQSRLNMLANLIASGTLDIKIAFARSKSGAGIYHEKMAIVIDGEGDSIAFSGSMNESAMAMQENYEAIDVFRSWDDPEERVRTKNEAFDAIWENIAAGVRTFDFPEVKEEIVERYLLSDVVDYDDDLLGDEPVGPEPAKYPIPSVPSEYTLRGYQLEAIDAWKAQGFRGIYDMATGTGKTVTALASIVELSQCLDNKLTVVIVCPYQHLVEQWVKDIVLFNIQPIVGYSSSSQRDWYERLERAITNQKYGVEADQFLCFVCTNGTYATEKVQQLLDKVRSSKLLVVDEAHNFGANYLRTLLRSDFEYRLALSATIVRHRDKEGTDSLFSYFGERCIEYTLEEAIYGRGDEPPCLTPYRYYPIIVQLEEDELKQYTDFSLGIAKEVRKKKSGEMILTEEGKKLAIMRARLVAAARQKLPTLRETIMPFTNEHYMLVYCGAAKVEIDTNEIAGVDDYEIRQADAVTEMLGNELGMRVSQFTSRENSKQREDIKQMFIDETLQALIAIKCLDEGVDIPMFKTAFILASSTNPREYVQRRGRLLRKDKNGLKKRAEIYDFITLPRAPAEAAALPEQAMCGEKRLAYNELVRAREFECLAENRSQVAQKIDELEECFFGLGGLASYDGEEIE